MDDRGKFIYISPEELEAVAKFIKQRGRVSIVELAESSNQLINLHSNISKSVSLQNWRQRTLYESEIKVLYTEHMNTWMFFIIIYVLPLTYYCVNYDYF